MFAQEFGTVAVEGSSLRMESASVDNPSGSFTKAWTTIRKTSVTDPIGCWTESDLGTGNRGGEELRLSKPADSIVQILVLKSSPSLQMARLPMIDPLAPPAVFFSRQTTAVNQPEPWGFTLCDYLALLEETRIDFSAEYEFLTEDIAFTIDLAPADEEPAPEERPEVLDVGQEAFDEMMRAQDDAERLFQEQLDEERIAYTFVRDD